MDGGSYIGAFRAISGIRGLVIVNHSPVGCRFSASVPHEISDQLAVRHTCSMIQENEVVFGGEEALKNAIVKARKCFAEPKIAVLSGDVPAAIGDDVRGVADLLSNDKDTVVVESPGFKGSMKDGYEEALLQLSSIMRTTEVRKNSVNLIGLCPDDFKVNADVKEICGNLSDAGITVNAAISNCTIREFIDAPAAELNVVIGQGRKLAEKMKADFGIPFIETPYPYGIEGTSEFINAIGTHLSNGYTAEPCIDIEPFKKIYLYLQSIYDTPVSIAGDHHAKPMSLFLQNELGFDIVVSGDFADNGSAFRERVLKSNALLLFGSSFENELASILDIPLIRYVYPVFDRIAIHDNSPHAGFGGTVCLTESILNAMIGHDYIDFA